MRRGLRRDVAERQTQIVLVQHVGRDLTAQKSREDVAVVVVQLGGAVAGPKQGIKSASVGNGPPVSSAEPSSRTVYPRAREVNGNRTHRIVILPSVMPFPEAPRPFTVAVAGGSGSGKTTLARAVATSLGTRCAVLDHDSYYRDLSHLPTADRSGVNFDHPNSLENELLVRQLGALRNGKAVEKPRYCFATHTRLPARDRIAPLPVILVEGILVLSLPELHNAFDLRVFVDASDTVRLSRRLARDTRERGRSPDSVRAQWAATVAPMYREFVEPCRATADLVISGESPLESGLLRVLDALPKPIHGG